MKKKLYPILLLIPAFLLFGFIKQQQEQMEYNALMENLEHSHQYTVKMIEAMPATDINYKPTEEVRSFAAQAFHCIYTTKWYNSSFRGSPIKWEPGDENRMSQSELIAWANTEFNQIKETIKGSDYDEKTHSRIVAFMDHNSHHLGQMLIYLRMKGIVPPEY